MIEGANSDWVRWCKSDGFSLWEQRDPRHVLTLNTHWINECVIFLQSPGGVCVWMCVFLPLWARPTQTLTCWLNPAETWAVKCWFSIKQTAVSISSITTVQQILTGSFQKNRLMFEPQTAGSQTHRNISVSSDHLLGADVCAKFIDSLSWWQVKQIWG